MKAADFARRRLFGPLGITDFVWPESPQGINIGRGELRMRPHDLAKIGYLYLRGGRWDNRQVVPSAWVEASTRSHIGGTLQKGYGYQWWVRDDAVFMALGYAGQYLVVVPAYNLVVVFTSDLPEDDFYLPRVSPEIQLHHPRRTVGRRPPSQPRGYRRPPRRHRSPSHSLISGRVGATGIRHKLDVRSISPIREVPFCAFSEMVMHPAGVLRARVTFL